MKVFSVAILILGFTLAGCSDVTPQVSFLRSRPLVVYAPEKNVPAVTDLSSLHTSQSADGYVLQSVVSKENNFVPLVSQDGYQLIPNSTLE